MSDLSVLAPFAWPIAVVVFGVFFLLLFQKQIRQLLGRATSFGKEGLRFHKDGDRAYEDAQHSAKRPDALTEFFEELETPLFREVESEIEEYMQTRGVTDPADVKKVLVKMLARAAIFGNFQVVQNGIFASQFNALSFLNAQAAPTTKATLKSLFYDKAVANFQKTYENRTFGEWLGYLQGQALVIETEEGMLLSYRGREFLIWRVDNGFSQPWYG